MMSPTGRIARTIFSEEHEAFRDSVRRFIAKEITPYHARWEKDGIVPRSAWKAAGEAGLLGIAMPEAYGGLGMDRRFVAVRIEEFGGTERGRTAGRERGGRYCEIDGG